ncbi:hypothetical protein IKG64_00015 [Candidatus Saccharibacteria bacterium]|nr:hypothetical protein [Candidatus Saccharibacteria bacterium]
MKKTLKWLATIGVLVAFCGVLIGGVDYSELDLPHRDTTSASVDVSTADNAEATEVTEGEGTDKAATIEGNNWYYIHNSECLANDTTEDDFNFGLRPDIENMTTQELYELWREVLWDDPTIGAANLAWFDRLFGTRYLGEFYETCQGNWAKTINLAKEKFMADEILYHDTLKAFFKYLESSVAKISVVHYTSGITDQMYVNPFTTSGVPDVVVFETDQKDGYFLKMELQIKSSTTGGNPAAGNGGENKGTLAFMVRADCLFQPANVAELLNITPQENPTKKTPATTTPTAPTPTTPAKTTPSSSTPSKSTPATPSKKPVQPVTPADPVKPDPKPTPTPTYNKDPSKGPEGDLVKPNNNTGTGESTNTGMGSKTSAAEKPESVSTGQTGQSHSDYKADQKVKEDVNNSQSTGKDPSTPSTKPAAKPDAVDSGNSANEATPKGNEVTYGSGTSIPSSGGATEAPPD